jgi:hypothetical protein
MRCDLLSHLSTNFKKTVGSENFNEKISSGLEGFRKNEKN